jgi:patatin-like phospholipase/acyl hydrolase
VLQGVDEANPLYNVRVKDACLATTAVPILLPAARFAGQVSGDRNPADKPKVFNVIDGGIAVNDPVGFSSSHFLQFVLPMNIDHSQKLLLSYINASILRI